MSEQHQTGEGGSLEQRVKVIEESHALIDTRLNEFEKQQLEHECYNLRRMRDSLVAEVKQMEKTHKTWAHIVQLNVGGTHFTTSLSTITQQPDSMLAAMFSGRHELATDSDGRVFIDRDGELFKHILAFLREGVSWQPPADPVLWHRLRAEFEYFQLVTGYEEQQQEEQQAQQEELPARARFMYALGGGDQCNMEFWDCVHGGRWCAPQRLAPLPAQRHACCAAAGLGGFLYLVGGWSRAGVWMRDVDRLDTNHIVGTERPQWESVAPMQVCRGGLGLVALGGRLYALGGKSANSTYEASMEIYDPDSNTWTLGPDMASARDGCAAVVAAGAVYVLGGKSSYGNSYLNTVERYDPREGSWRAVPDMMDRRGGLAAVTVNDEVYVIGGSNVQNPAGLASCEKLDVRMEHWTYVRPMRKPRFDLGAVTVGNKIYALGGFCESAPTALVEWYDVRSGEWGMGTDMTCPRSLFGATVL